MSNIIKSDTFEIVRDRFVDAHPLPADKAMDAFHREAVWMAMLVNSDKRLFSATKESLLSSFMNVAQLGLTLNPSMKQGYLIVRREKDDEGYKNVAKFEPSYMGMISLLYGLGIIQSIQSEWVYGNDDREIDLADPRIVVRHIPWFLSGASESGDPMAVYARASMKDGGTMAAIMSVGEVNEIRGMSDSYKYAEGPKGNKDSVWHKHYSEMGKKTALHRLFKTLPKMPDARTERLSQYIQQMEADYNLRPERSLQPRVRPTRLPAAQMDELKMAISRGDETVASIIEKHPGIVDDQVGELRASSEQ